MTNQEIEDKLLAYHGEPFLVGEFASVEGVTWHRMKRLCDRLVKQGKLQTYRNTGWQFYYRWESQRHMNFQFITNELIKDKEPG